MKALWDDMGDPPTVENLLEKLKNSKNKFEEQAKKIDEIQRVIIVLFKTIGDVLQMLNEHDEKIELLGTVALGHEAILEKDRKEHFEEHDHVR